MKRKWNILRDNEILLIVSISTFSLDKPQYGYELWRYWQTLPNPISPKTSGGFYRLLRKLERMGYIKSRWNGRHKRRYYTRTDKMW